MESYNTYSNRSVSKFLRIIEFKNLAILLLVLVLCGLAGGFIIWSDKVVNNDTKPKTEYPDVKLTFTGRTLSSKCLVERIQDFRRIKIDRIFSTNFNQLFLVSHFESMYGRFVNADIVQLEEA